MTKLPRRQVPCTLAVGRTKATNEGKTKCREGERLTPCNQLDESEWRSDQTQVAREKRGFRLQGVVAEYLCKLSGWRSLLTDCSLMCGENMQNVKASLLASAPQGNSSSRSFCPRLEFRPKCNSIRPWSKRSQAALRSGFCLRRVSKVGSRRIP